MRLEENRALFGFWCSCLGGKNSILMAFNLYFATFRGGDFSGFNISEIRYLPCMKGLLTNGVENVMVGLKIGFVRLWNKCSRCGSPRRTLV